MTTDGRPPQVFTNRFADAAGPGSGGRELCRCVGYSKSTRPASVVFHAERQDATAPGWLRLLELIEEAAADGRAKFTPFAELSADERRGVVTLPRTIGKLTAVKHLVLYGTNLVRLPPEIGAMSGLEGYAPVPHHGGPALVQPDGRR